jgi:hypothetical protein
MIHKFSSFLDKREREAKEHLTILKKVLEKEHMEVSDHLHDEKPYLFVKDSERNCSFDGIRIYVIGDSVAFRIQKEDDTHPYGKAYGLDVEGMYYDLISDKMDEDKAGTKMVKAIVTEIKKFFEKSAEAERDLRASELDGSGDPMGRVLVKSTGTDYSQMVQSRG